MNWRRSFLILPFLFVGCATSQQTQLDLATVQGQKVPSPIYDKIAHAEALSTTDIITLTSRQVSDDIIIRAIFASGAVYRLDSQAIVDLKKNQVSDRVIDALLKTVERYYQDQLNRQEIFYPGYPYYPYPAPYFRHYHHYR